MQRVQKQSSESENAQRTAQAKFTSKSREAEQTNGIDDSPAMIAQRKKLNSLFGGAIQRVEDEEPLQGKFETAQCVEEEEALQGKFDAVQRVEEEEPLQGKFEIAQRVEEEEPLQGKFETAQRVEEEEPLQGKFEATSSTQLKEEAAKPNNTGLPDNLKSGIESLSGMSMDNVKVHYNSSQPAQLNALAYAQGTDIHVAPGQEQHLPHEAWHVVQQAQGRVKPTMQMKEGVPVNDDKSLEHEADVMGGKAVQMNREFGGYHPEHVEDKKIVEGRNVAAPLISQREKTASPDKTIDWDDFVDKAIEDGCRTQLVKDMGGFLGENGATTYPHFHVYITGKIALSLAHGINHTVGNNGVITISSLSAYVDNIPDGPVKRSVQWVLASAS